MLDSNSCGLCNGDTHKYTVKTRYNFYKLGLETNMYCLLSVTITGESGKISHTLYKASVSELPVAAAGREKACPAQERILDVKLLLHLAPNIRSTSPQPPPHLPVQMMNYFITFGLVKDILNIFSVWIGNWNTVATLDSVKLLQTKIWNRCIYMKEKIFAVAMPTCCMSCKERWFGGFKPWELRGVTQCRSNLSEFSTFH